jgi:hypothetical protein
MPKTDLSDFCLFILTHGRPDRVYTYNTLRRAGYTGPIYIVLDDEDATAEQYQARFGDSVVTFSKDEAAQYTDVADNTGDRRAVVYARNACFDIAKRLGYRYFAQFDDDYTYIAHRFDDYFFFDYKPITNLDRVFSIYLEFYRSTPTSCLAMSQGGDFLGGQGRNQIQGWGPTSTQKHEHDVLLNRPPVHVHGESQRRCNRVRLPRKQGEAVPNRPEYRHRSKDNAKQSGRAH